MSRSCISLTFVGLSVFAFVGCEASIDSMTLYSLDGDFMPGMSKPWPGETFQQYPVLGKTDVTSPDDRRAILTAVKRGIAEADEHSHIMCFWPHHGVSLVRKGQRIEYLICFHCRQVSIFGDGEYRHVNTTDASADLLNTRLQAGGVPQQKQ